MSIPIIFCLGIRGVVYSDVFRAEYYAYMAKIFQGNITEYPGISVIFQSVFRRIELGISDFSPSETLYEHFSRWVIEVDI